MNREVLAELRSGLQEDRRKLDAWCETWVAAGGKREELAPVLDIGPRVQRVLQAGPSGFAPAPKCCTVLRDPACILDGHVPGRWTTTATAAVRPIVDDTMVDLVTVRKLPLAFTPKLGSLLPTMWKTEAHLAAGAHGFWYLEHVSFQSVWRIHIQYLLHVGITGRRDDRLDDAVAASLSGYHLLSFEKHGFTAFAASPQVLGRLVGRAEAN